MFRVFTFMVLVVASPVTAQFASPVDDAAEPCSERRHLEPEYFDTFDVRDAHKVELIQRMRTAQAFNTIVETGECSCEDRFPNWAAAIKYFQENYAGIEDRHEIYAQTAIYREIINSRRLDARAICVTDGNW